MDFVPRSFFPPIGPLIPPPPPPNFPCLPEIPLVHKNSLVQFSFALDQQQYPPPPLSCCPSSPTIVTRLSGTVTPPIVQLPPESTAILAYPTGAH